MKPLYYTTLFWLFLFTNANITNSLAQTNILFEENFDNNHLLWMTGSNMEYSAAVQDGEYQIAYKQAEGVWYFWQSIPIHTDTSYRIEASIAPYLDGKNSVYGLLWGVYDANNYNAFLVSNMGKASVITCRGGVFKTIVDWTEGNNYQNNQQHLLAIHYQGGKLGFWVDNKEMISMPPLDFKGGFAGFILSGKTQAQIDYLKVYQNRTIHLVENAVQGLEKENLGSVINSTYQELHPVIAPDGQTLYVTRKGHPNNIGADKKDDAWVSYKQKDGSWSLLQPLGFPINNDNHNQIIAVSPDNNSLLIGNTYHADGSFKGRGVSMATRQEDGKWGVPEEILIDNFYNHNSVASMHLAASKNILLTALERNDSKGHLDLHVSFKQKNGRFSQPKNLGDIINTPYEDGTPFLAADGKTLYFCSAGHGGYGSTDIFVSKRLDNTWTNWSEPKNLGPEINTTSWEGHYSVTASGSTAYLVSSSGVGHIGGDDIYKVIPPLAARPEPVLLVKGKVLDARTDLPLQSRIFYYEEATKTEAGTALSNQQKGNYQIVLPANATYSFLTYKEGYYPESQVLEVGKIEEYTEIYRNIYLHPIEEGTEVPFHYLSFDKQDVLDEKSAEELDRLAIFMEKYPLMQVTIQGDDANENKAIKNYLTEKKGIETTRILPTKIPQQKEPSFVITNLSTADQTVQRKGNFDRRLKVNSLQKGQVFRLDKMQFEADSADIVLASANELLVVYQFLQKNEKITIEIGGHTNGLPATAYCDSLSEIRANNARQFLIDKGIAPDRLTAKGYGKRQPIATNATLRGRIQNQRIEIKITNTGKPSQVKLSGVSTYQVVGEEE